MRESTFTNAICKAESKQISKDFAYCENAVSRAENAIGNLPSAQPEKRTEERTETHACDCISRQDAIDAIKKSRYLLEAMKKVIKLPPTQPERKCVNCGRTANNGGWYEDGRTRCPIEEHYALPKDGYCHLWEKRKDWEDNYVKRSEEGEK